MAFRSARTSRRPSWLGCSVDPGGWWTASKLRCGLLLMGPSGCGAVEVVVPIPMASLG